MSGYTTRVVLGSVMLGGAYDSASHTLVDLQDAEAMDAANDWPRGATWIEHQHTVPDVIGGPM